jgi:FKBP-type peptidyl-prolyl cis-trans isomerase (trigger factor)
MGVFGGKRETGPAERTHLNYGTKNKSKYQTRTKKIRLSHAGSFPAESFSTQPRIGWQNKKLWRTPMISALNKLDDGTLELTITIPWAKVSKSCQKVLEELATQATIKGFRKGKAPAKMVEEKLGKQHLYEETLKEILPQIYLEAVKEHHLKPVVNPQITVNSLAENKDWQIKATTCELPKVDLGNYKDNVKKALATEKIWVPGKDKKAEPENESQRIDKIFKALIENVKINIPEILIQDEVNRMLSRLIDQTARLGLTVEQYLASTGKTTDQIKNEYQNQAKETIKLELILSSIADEEKIQVTDEEVQKMIEAIPEEEAKKTFQTPEQKAYIIQLLRKRRVIDNLAKL